MGWFSIDEHSCAECYECKIKDRYCGKVRCSYYCKYVMANAVANDCPNFLKKSSRSDDDIKEAINYSKNYKSDCYITTALCQILSMPDNNNILNILRDFRNNYLQKTKDGLELLIQYDVIGPKISENLRNDKGKFNIAHLLLNKYILKTTEAILNNKQEEAKKIYVEMTNKLVKFYGIDDNIEVNIEEIEPSLSGHGKLVKKII